MHVFVIIYLKLVSTHAEATADVLPRLFKIKYESGTLEELLYVDMPKEYQNSSGQIVLDYAKAIQESVFEQLRVVREGKLRLVFSSDLKVIQQIIIFLRLHVNVNIYSLHLFSFHPINRYALGSFVLDITKSLSLEGY